MEVLSFLLLFFFFFFSISFFSRCSSFCSFLLFSFFSPPLSLLLEVKLFAVFLRRFLFVSLDFSYYGVPENSLRRFEEWALQQPHQNADYCDRVLNTQQSMFDRKLYRAAQCYWRLSFLCLSSSFHRSELIRSFQTSDLYFREVRSAGTCLFMISRMVCRVSIIYFYFYFF